MAELKKGKRGRRSRHEWQTLLTKFDDGDIGVEAFCRRQAISTASFYRWRNLLDNAVNGEGAGCNGLCSTASPAFVDLGVLDAPSTRTPQIDLKLDLGGGLTLHLVRN